MNLAVALNRHRFELERGTHRNVALLALWKQFGAQDFSFTELGTIKPRDDPAFDLAVELEAMPGLLREEHSRLGAEIH